MKKVSLVLAVVGFVLVTIGIAITFANPLRSQVAIIIPNNKTIRYFSGTV